MFRISCFGFRILAWVDLVQRGESGRGQQKSLFRMRRRRGVQGTRSYLSRPDRGGVSTSVAPDFCPGSPLVEDFRPGTTGCCGFAGPIPSATLDKIQPSCQTEIVGEKAGRSNPFLQKIRTCILSKGFRSLISFSGGKRSLGTRNPWDALSSGGPCRGSGF